MNKKSIRLLSNLLVLFSLINFVIIVTIAYIVSYKPELIIKIFFVLAIIAFTFGIMTFIYKIIMIIFFYEKMNQESLIKMKDLYSEFLVWLSTGILVIILLIVYRFL